MTKLNLRFRVTNMLIFFRSLGVFLFFLAPCGFASAGYIAPVAKSGQTTSYAAGDNGALQSGVAWPSIRFTDNSDGTVTDELTGLIWMKNADCWGYQTWANALSKVAGLNSGSETCSGYTSGTHTDWRLPTIKELESLVDIGHVSPALPSGHAFVGVQTDDYWSSSTRASNTSYAWYVALSYGYVNYYFKTYSNYVWPVRGGQ